MRNGLILSVLLISFFTQPLMVASGTGATVFPSKADEQLMCLCGCNQTIKNCPHENCSFAIPARKKIAEMTNAGKDEAEILDFFIQKYGEEILAAPKKEGFNLLGYIMPFVALIVAAGVIITILRKWTTRGIKDEEATLPLAQRDIDSDIDAKIEKELEELD